MSNDFREIMAKRTDEQLIKIVTVDKDGYQPEALEAAREEIEKRQLDPAKVQTVVQEQTRIVELQQSVNKKEVETGTRFLNFVIDTIVWMFSAAIVVYFVGMLLHVEDPAMARIIGWVIMIASYVAYYTLMEFKFQKTVGKYLTRTMVVTLEGNKPDLATIVSRSTSRLLPLEGISFLFMEKGIHDLLSKTRVIKDRR